MGVESLFDKSIETGQERTGVIQKTSSNQCIVEDLISNETSILGMGVTDVVELDHNGMCGIDFQDLREGRMLVSETRNRSGFHCFVRSHPHHQQQSHTNLLRQLRSTRRIQEFHHSTHRGRFMINHNGWRIHQTGRDLREHQKPNLTLMKMDRKFLKD